MRQRVLAPLARASFWLAAPHQALQSTGARGCLRAARWSLHGCTIVRKSVYLVLAERESEEKKKISIVCRELLSVLDFESVMVEEAAEIVEPHISAAIPSSAKRLIMIGDHQQLRPKVNNYELQVCTNQPQRGCGPSVSCPDASASQFKVLFVVTAEQSTVSKPNCHMHQAARLQVKSGRGYDLDMSLFERLVASGIEYVSLGHQHRMRPEISRIVRTLTYPHLQDAPGTLNRQHLRGLGSQANGIASTETVIFVSHTWPESADSQAGMSALESASKVNLPEAHMVVRALKYLLQQGYKHDEIVVLTPYLGQLRQLRQIMRDEAIDEVADQRDEEALERQGLELEVRRTLAAILFSDCQPKIIVVLVKASDALGVTMPRLLVRFCTCATPTTLSKALTCFLSTS
jgi:hypothetical protein